MVGNWRICYVIKKITSIHASSTFFFVQKKTLKKIAAATAVFDAFKEISSV